MAFTRDALFYLTELIHAPHSSKPCLLIPHVNLSRAPGDTYQKGREMGLLRVIWEVINRPFCSPFLLFPNPVICLSNASLDNPDMALGFTTIDLE